MAALTTQPFKVSGTLIAFSPATVTTGDTFQADDRTTLLVNNASGGSVNATVTIGPKGVGATTIGPLVVACAIGITAIGPCGASAFNDPTNLNTKVVMSSVTSVTLAAVSS